ncbi:histidine kinase [Flavobacterium sp.]|uniref:histidine kinase n=1 Tax=Flavobacterium sp. TaxID=239 RepID=UPI0039E63BE7
MFRLPQLIRLLFFLFVFSAGFAQNRNVDSLKVVLANPKINDTARIGTLLALMDHTITWSKEHMGYVYQLEPIFRKGLEIKHSKPEVKEKYHYAAAVYYYNVAKKESIDGKGNPPAHFDEAMKYFKLAHEEKAANIAMVSKGAHYLKLANYPKAFECYFLALKFYESINNESGIANVNKEIGGARLVQREWQKAIGHLQKALKYYDVPVSTMYIGDRYEVSVIYNNLGVAYNGLGKFEEAHQCFLKAHDFIKRNNDPSTESIILVKLAGSSADLARPADTQRYLQQALELSKTDASRQMVYTKAADIYYRNKNYDKAAEYGELAYVMLKETKSIHPMTALSTILYKIYKESGQYEKALKMYEVSMTLKDSTQLESSKNELAQRQLKYDFEKKELQQKILQQKKLEALKLEAAKEKAMEASRNKLEQQQLRYDFEKRQLNEKLTQGKKLTAIKLESQKKTAAIKLEGERKAAVKNNWLIGLSGILLLIVLGGIFYYRNSRQKQSIAVLEKNQIKQKLLVTQMNPHFIFNSVHNIRNLIDNHQNKDAVKYLDKFAVLTRQILEHSNENYISLEEEVDMIRNYLMIQQLLYNHKFDFEVSVEEDIDTESTFLPPMLTQPFIENAIKHGLGNKAANGRVEVRFFLDAGKLFFEVTDNGQGFDATKVTTNHKSLAMTITKERLVGYTKNQDFNVQTDNIKDQHENIVGAKVRFEIPYIYEN